MREAILQRHFHPGVASPEYTVPLQGSWLLGETTTIFFLCFFLVWGYVCCSMSCVFPFSYSHHLTLPLIAAVIRRTSPVTWQGSIDLYSFHFLRVIPSCRVPSGCAIRLGGWDYKEPYASYKFRRKTRTTKKSLMTKWYFK